MGNVQALIRGRLRVFFGREGEFRPVLHSLLKFAAIARAALVLSLIAAVFMTSTGLVLRMGPSEVTSVAEWYPCIGHQCGCRDAASCRAHCCCAVQRPVAVASPVKKSCCPMPEDGELLQDVESWPEPAEHQSPPTAAEETAIAFHMEIRSASCSFGDAFINGKIVSWIVSSIPATVLSLEILTTLAPSVAGEVEPPAFSPPVPPPRA